MNIVSFGGGTNSTAMIIGMYQHKIPIDLILFADTGGEQPHTYAFIETFNRWLVERGLPALSGALSSIRSEHRISIATTIRRAKRCGPAASVSTNTSAMTLVKHAASSTRPRGMQWTKNTKSTIRFTSGAGPAKIVSM